MKLVAFFEDKIMTGVQNRILHLQPFFALGIERLKNSIMKNFEEQGRPKRWKPLAEATLLAGGGYRGRRFTQAGSASKGFQRHLAGRQILIKSGMLRNSINGEATNREGIVGSNMVQAALLHYGGNAGRGLKVFVPARPYVMIQDEDRAQLKLDLKRWVMAGQ